MYRLPGLSLHLELGRPTRVVRPSCGQQSCAREAGAESQGGSRERRDERQNENVAGAGNGYSRSRDVSQTVW